LSDDRIAVGATLNAREQTASHTVIRIDRTAELGGVASRQGWQQLLLGQPSQLLGLVDHRRLTVDKNLLLLSPADTHLRGWLDQQHSPAGGNIEAGGPSGNVRRTAPIVAGTGGLAAIKHKTAMLEAVQTDVRTAAAAREA
jgi:hypothetical protein